MNIYEIGQDFDNYKFFVFKEDDKSNKDVWDYNGQSLVNEWKGLSLELFRDKRKKKDTTLSCLSLVREAGVEPARPCEHWHLKPASLPIPPLARGVCAVLFSASSILPQSFASVNTFLQKNHFLVKRMFS